MKRTYSEKLRDPRWQRKRLEIMQRDGFACRLCGDKENTLNVHHLYYDRDAEPWDYPSSALVTTCEVCHEDMHVARHGAMFVQALIAGGARTEDLYDLQHFLDAAFLEGPDANVVPRERWLHVINSIRFAIAAVKGGASFEDVRSALSEYLPKP